MSEPHAWLESNVPLVTRVVTQTARRCRLSAQDRDELLSLVWSHLTRDDYRVLRQYRGTNAISAYLRVVVGRVLLDMRTSNWGKWRPSAEAVRNGAHAVAFERLVIRDGHAPAAAREVLRRRGVSLPLDIETRLMANPTRWRRRFVELGAAISQPSGEGDPFTKLVDRHHERRARTIAARLEQALSALPAADQVLIRMRHEQGLKVSEIATMLNVDQKKLYRRLDAIHADLRTALVGDGVCRGEAVALTSGAVSHFPPVFAHADRAC